VDLDAELSLLLDLDGAAFEAAEGYVVEFSVVRTAATPQRPHGVSYALVLRMRDGGGPIVRFDNAHPVRHRGGRFVARPAAFDHWHRTAEDPGRPYRFSTAAQLLEDFWREVKRALDERGAPNDL